MDPTTAPNPNVYQPSDGPTADTLVSWVNKRAEKGGDLSPQEKRDVQSALGKLGRSGLNGNPTKTLEMALRPLTDNGKTFMHKIASTGTFSDSAVMTVVRQVLESLKQGDSPRQPTEH